MLAYPVHLELDDNGTLLVTAPDFPELTTFGADREEAVSHAVDAVEEAIAARIHEGKDIPAPSAGQHCAALPALTEAKVSLYRGMKDLGIGKEELAYQLGQRSYWVDVDQVLDIQRGCQVDLMDAALRTVGYRLTVTAAAD